MKSRVFFVLFLLVSLLVISTQKSKLLHNTISNIIIPIKQVYKNITQTVEDRSKSYIFQKENINKLTRENKVLKKYLLDQTQYLQQVSQLFQQIPSLQKLPYKSTTIVDTISYIKLNSLNEVLLTMPKKNPLSQTKVYGLIQKNSVGGTAVVIGDNLYGYLTSNKRCKFSVFIGKNRTPGVAQGVDSSTMLIKYIPKWAKINVGDRVETSGLDGIFFENIPVGKVESIKVENSYKTAYTKTFSDTLHPNFFFLITDTKPRLVSHYDQNSSFPEDVYSILEDENTSQKEVTSIPTTLQTKESEVDLSEFEIPKEKIDLTPVSSGEINKKGKKKSTNKVRKPKKKRVSTKQTPVKIKPKPKPKRRNPLDIFRE